MTLDNILAAVDHAFAHIPRPTSFLRGTCFCDECTEHDRTMQSLTPPDLPLDELARPAWDPICAASNEAFGYLTPGLVRLALSHPREYLEQFLFHIEQPERLAFFDRAQSEALVQVLERLTIEESALIDEYDCADQIFRAAEELQSAANRNS